MEVMNTGKRELHHTSVIQPRKAEGQGLKIVLFFEKSTIESSEEGAFSQRIPADAPISILHCEVGPDTFSDLRSLLVDLPKTDRSEIRKPSRAGEISIKPTVKITFATFVHYV